MSTIMCVLTLVAALALAPFGCGKKEEPPKPKGEVTKEQLQEQGAKALEMAKDFLNQQKNQFFKDTQEQLANLQKKIDELQTQAEKAAPDLKAKLAETVKNLRAKGEAVKKQLQDSQTATGKLWEDFKSKMQDTLQEIKQDLEKAEKT